MIKFILLACLVFALSLAMNPFQADSLKASEDSFEAILKEEAGRRAKEAKPSGFGTDIFKENPFDSASGGFSFETTNRKNPFGFGPSNGKNPFETKNGEHSFEF